MTRILSIIGMSIALLLFGVWTIILGVVLPIMQRHLSPRLIVVLVGFAYTDWFIFRELRQKIRKNPQPRPQTPVDSN
jgi:hypothetical protein